MNIEFSRHAKRRAKLYGISESVVIDLVEKNAGLRQGINDIIENVEGLRYPLKVVVKFEGDLATIVTNYPLKKARII
jgi:hypothetical protein